MQSMHRETWARKMSEQRSSEAVVWADEATPFTGPQVKALLEENERLKLMVLAARGNRREAHALLVRATRVLEGKSEGPEKRSGGRVRRSATTAARPDRGSDGGPTSSGHPDAGETAKSKSGLPSKARKKRKVSVVSKPRRRRTADVRGASHQEPGATKETSS